MPRLLNKRLSVSFYNTPSPKTVCFQFSVRLNRVCRLVSVALAFSLKVVSLIVITNSVLANDDSASVDDGVNQAEIGAVIATLDEYMSAVNRIDIRGVTDTYLFPHFRVAGGELVVWESAEEAMPMLAQPIDEQKRSMRKALGNEWQRTDWLRREVISLTERKAHVDTEFVRIDTKGEEISRFRSLYILVKVAETSAAIEGATVWKIIGRSSYAP